ncbi:capsid protein [Listeria monocytogenes]|uniref:capsid protein n=1 Tax=Listeria monocytogenes TaxID=1639 RepID=UPI000C822894|nr:capsid protein [Listeria monocytogenes]EAC4425319.1 capsid protein [Listeria monocytogenes]EAE6434634.1 capsid protein [Listeria monocytogenes]EAE6437671.1 capsid protein [Listeria monocytogenes]EAE8567876.1 capsid protein [Listeria monocytogenes]EAF1263078.1 capsid protein [Listeria monocytogenes]
MPVILDAKDLAKLDREFAAESVIWSVLGQGGQELTESDFVGAKEVRVNKMTGFTASDYKRNADNTRNKIDVQKETRKLEKERWMAYDLDVLDQSENGSYDIANVMAEHTRLVAIPEKDQTGAQRLLENAGKLVKEEVTTANSLAVYDAAEQYMLDEEVVGPFVMFASSDYYQALKNNEKVSKTFSVNEVNINGINRKVGQLDGDIPIIKVPKSRLQVDEAKVVNFILVPLRIAMPIEKYNDVTLIPADQDRNGYRDTIKGLDYYDMLVFDNAKKAIYVSYKDATSGN